MYRKKPVVIEAEQWLGAGCTLQVGGVLSQANLTQYDGAERCEHCGHPLYAHAKCSTLEGYHIVCPKDWIIKGIKGEFYPCKPDIFEETYEKVEEN